MGREALVSSLKYQLFQIAAVGRALCDELRSASVRVVCGHNVRFCSTFPLKAKFA